MRIAFTPVLLIGLLSAPSPSSSKDASAAAFHEAEAALLGYLEGLSGMDPPCNYCITCGSVGHEMWVAGVKSERAEGELHSCTLSSCAAHGHGGCDITFAFQERLGEDWLEQVFVMAAAVSGQAPRSYSHPGSNVRIHIDRRSLQVEACDRIVAHLEFRIQNVAE